MAVLTSPAFRASSWAVPKIDLHGCVLNASLWRPDLGGDTFVARDGFTYTNDGTEWGYQGRTFVVANTDFITANGAATTLQALTSGAIELWAKLTATAASQTFFCLSDAGDAASALSLYWNTMGTIYAYCVEAGSVYYNQGFTGSALTAGTWYHIVMTHNATTPAMYLNTVSKAIGAGGADYTKFFNAVNDIDDVSLGGLNISTGRTIYLGGVIGEVRIYNRVLTAGEVIHNYQVTRWRYA